VGRRLNDYDAAAIAVVTAVVCNLAAGIGHGTVHVLVPVHQPPWQLGLVTLAKFLGPLLGTWLVVTGNRRAGGALVAVSLSIALAFEGLAHFVVQNPDFVGTIASMRGLFAGTAWASLAGDLVGVLAGAWCWMTA
jgi:hypothetical protein